MVPLLPSGPLHFRASSVPGGAGNAVRAERERHRSGRAGGRRPLQRVAQRGVGPGLLREIGLTRCAASSGAGQPTRWRGAPRSPACTATPTARPSARCWRARACPQGIWWASWPPGSSPGRVGCAGSWPRRSAPCAAGSTRPWPCGAREQPYRALVVSWDLGRVQVARGRLRAALRTYRDALELATRAVPAGASVAGIAHVGLADVLCEQDALDAALEHAETGIERCTGLANRMPCWRVGHPRPHPASARRSGRRARGDPRSRTGRTQPGDDRPVQSRPGPAGEIDAGPG